MDIDGWGVVDIWATGLGKDTKGTLFSDRIGSFFLFYWGFYALNTLYKWNNNSKYKCKYLYNYN